MFRRRRALLLLSMFVTSLGAGGTSYWWYTSSTRTPLGKEPITAQVTAPAEQASPADLTDVPATHSHVQHKRELSESHAADTFASSDEHDATPTEPAAHHEQPLADAEALQPSIEQHAQSTNAMHGAYRVADRWGGASFTSGGVGGTSKSKDTRQQSAAHDEHAQNFDTPVVENTEPGANDETVADNNEPAVTTPATDRDSCAADSCDSSHDSKLADNTPTEHTYPVPDETDSSNETPRVSVPEPASLGLLALGLFAAGLSRRRKARLG